MKQLEHFDSIKQLSVLDKINKDIMEQRVVVTTAQNMASVNKGFIKNLENFIKQKNVDKVYIFQVKGKNIDDNENGLHPFFKSLKNIGGADVEIVTKTPAGGMNIGNSNIKLFHSQMLPQAVHPLRGLHSKLPRNSSYVVNATKVRFETMAVSNPKKPRTLTTTGAITNHRYRENVQTGVKAMEMHTIGFTYLELLDKTYFNQYPIIATKTGNFTHQEWKYSNGEIKKEEVKALILGDIHRAVVDKKAIAESIKQIELLKPKVVVLHDLHDGRSINRHEYTNMLDKVIRWKQKYESLEKELGGDLNFLLDLSNRFPNTKFLIVESNHDDFLRTYINSLQYTKDPQNYVFISKMIEPLLKYPKKPILQIALELIGDIPKNIKFLNKDDEVRIGGKLVSQHGDKGVSGSRGSPAQFEKNNAKAVGGHTHSPLLYSNGATTGHLSDIKKQYYAKGGLSKWLQANVSIDSLNKLHILVLKNNFKK